MEQPHPWFYFEKQWVTMWSWFVQNVVFQANLDDNCRPIKLGRIKNRELYGEEME